MRLEHDREGRLPTKICKQCDCLLGKYYNDDLCPTCKEQNLFSEVKEYIRSTDANEYDVARFFHIPVSKVRTWINDGMIEYKNINDSNISSVRCHVCGKRITSGTICPGCRRRQQLEETAVYSNKVSAGEMRFVGSRRSS